MSAKAAARADPGLAAEPAPQAGKRRHRLRRAIIALVSVILVVAVAVLGGVGWVGSERAIHMRQKTFPHQIGEYPNLRGEEVAVPSSTGITISGTLFPGRSRATIVISHGLGNNRNEVLPWADFLNRAGYTTFIYDMRSRGASGGDAITYGALEQDDLISIVDYLARRPDVDPARIGAMGVSLGGATTILAAAREPRIKAVVESCAFTEVDEVINTAFEHFIGLPAFPFGPITKQIAEWRLGIDTAKARPIDAIGKISPRPILIMHGMADEEVPYSNGERLYGAAGEPKTLWLHPDARHGMHQWEIATAEFEQRVIAFFRQGLGE